MVKSFRRAGQVWLVLFLVIGFSMLGCRRLQRPGASTTAPQPTASVTTPQPVAGDETDVALARRLERFPPAEEPLQETSLPAADSASDSGDPSPTPPPEQPGPFFHEDGAGLMKLVAIDIRLPAPAFRGTPKPANEPNVQPPLGKPRPPFLAPEGTVNLAAGKPAICSDPMPNSGEVDLVTDGDKEASDFGYLGMRPGTEWLQIDLLERATIYAVLVWHNHAEARVYRDVIVQVSDDPDFLDPQTVFNNDYDNSSGMGIGPDMGYIETSEGKLIDCKGVEGRYLRFFSRGNHIDDKNHYTEVEVFGRPIR